MNNNYFVEMSDIELYEFNNLWTEAGKTGFLKQDKKVEDALEFYRNVSSNPIFYSNLPTVQCEIDLLKEIANRWAKGMK